MKLATIRTPDGPRAVRLENDLAVDLGLSDVVDVLQRPDWKSWARSVDGPSIARDSLDFVPVVGAPEKIVCVGLNYRQHILEMGRELPAYPTLFAKFNRALIGARDEICLSPSTNAMDWEAELGVVVGASVRHATVEEAEAAIAGYTIVNDVTARDYQNRTPQWLQGKTFEHTTPVGPWLETEPADPSGLSFELSCTVDGDTVQRANTADLVFSPAQLIAYISTIITLVPGDLVATGTPGGVGHARTPPRYLGAGNVVITRIEGLGECRNTCVPDPT